MKLADLARRDAPACWSWTVPELRTVEEVAELLARHQLPPHVCSNAVSGVSALWRFIEYHAGRCAVCGEVVGLLVVDHKHGPRTVRGCLCQGCNMLEGRGGRDLPIFAAYRREHPALTLGYYEPYRGNGASQRVLHAVHAATRAERYRELRIADVTSWIRLLAQKPNLRADDLVRSKLHELGRLWQTVAQGSHRPTPELLNRLAVFCKHMRALADVRLPPHFEQVDLAPLPDIVTGLAHECAQLVAAARPTDRVGRAKAVKWIPPWER